MIKNVLLIFCLCLMAGIWLVHLRKPISSPTVLPQMTAIKPASFSATVALPQRVNKVAIVQTGVSSNTFSETELMTTNTSAGDNQEIAEQEKYQLLRELREWAAKDAEHALAAAMKLPAGDERNQALVAVCFGLAQSDPADAVKLAQTLQLNEQPGAVMENLVQQWAATDLSAALEWADNQPASGQRDEITTRIAYVMSQTDPTSAANLVISQIPPGLAQDEAVMTVLNQWGNQNPIAATAWVKEFPEGPLQARAISEIEGIVDRQQTLVRR